MYDVRLVLREFFDIQEIHAAFVLFLLYLYFINLKLKCIIT